jgi:hypothetical protein
LREMIKKDMMVVRDLSSRNMHISKEWKVLIEGV